MMTLKNQDAEFQRAIFEGKVKQRHGFDWSKDKENEAFGHFKQALWISVGRTLNDLDLHRLLYHAENVELATLTDRNRLNLQTWMETTRQLIMQENCRPRAAAR